jgi:hypothetical protein
MRLCKDVCVNSVVHVHVYMHVVHVGKYMCMHAFAPAIGQRLTATKTAEGRDEEVIFGMQELREIEQRRRKRGEKRNIETKKNAGGEQ